MSQSTIDSENLSKNQFFDQQHALYRSNSCQRKRTSAPKWLKQLMNLEFFNDYYQENRQSSYQNQQNYKEQSKTRQHMWQEKEDNQQSQTQTQVQKSSNKNNPQPNTNQTLQDQQSKGKSSKQSKSGSSNSQKQNKLQINQEVQEQISKEFDLTFDALQLEAFYYWLTEIGSSTSPLLSLPPIISYYLYGMLLFDFNGAQNLLQNDKGLDQFGVQLISKPSLIDKIKLHSTVKSQAYREKKIRMYFNECAFLSIIPENITINEIDQNMIIEDLLLYSQQYIDIIQKGNTIEQIDKLLKHTVNNLALGYIRFVFVKEQQGKQFEFRYPISQFDDDQCLDYHQIYNLIDQNQLNGDLNFLRSFTKKEDLHSEKALVLWLIYDLISNNNNSNKKSIFQQLEDSFKVNQIIDSQLILKYIQLEITQKNKTCKNCVKMFNKFPIRFYCNQLLDKFGFQIKSEIHLLIIGQYFQNPYYYDNVEDLYIKPTLYEYRIKAEGQSNIQQQQDINQQQDNNQNLNQITQNQQQFIQQTNEIQTQLQLQQDQQLDSSNLVQSNQNNETLEAQIDFQLEQQIQVEQINESQQINQQQFTQEINQQQFTQEIRYFIVQNDLEVTGLISKQMFNKRYRVDGQQINNKLKIYEVPLTNTYFASTGKLEDLAKKNSEKSQESSLQKQEIHQSQKGSVKTSSISKKSSLSGINRLTEELRNNKNFMKIKQLQRQKILIEKQSREQSQIFAYEKLSDNFQTKFFSSLVIHYCQNVENKNFSQFQIDQFSILFQQIVSQNQIFGNQLYKKFKQKFIGSEIIFNHKINKEILFKDYLFLKTQVNPVIEDQNITQENIIHNEYAFQVFSFDKATQQWQVQQLSNQFDVTIKSCQEFIQVIQQSLSTINQQQNVTYYLLICTLYEIAEGCKKQIEEQLNNLLIPLQFVKIEFCSIDLKTENNNHDQIQQKIEQSQYQIEFGYKNYNLLNIDNFQNRYKAENCISRTSFNHFTKELITQFSFFDCEHHDVIQKIQKMKLRLIKQ